MKIQKAMRITCAMIIALSVASCGSEEANTLETIDFVGVVFSDELKSTDGELFLNLGGVFVDATALTADNIPDTELHQYG